MLTMAIESATIIDAPAASAGQAGHVDDRRVAAKRLVEAIAARDYKGIFGAFAPDARFRYLIPPGPGEVVVAAEVAAKYFQWFGDADLIRVESVLIEPLADPISVRYRFQLYEQER